MPRRRREERKQSVNAVRRQRNQPDNKSLAAMPEVPQNEHKSNSCFIYKNCLQLLQIGINWLILAQIYE